ncbi:MAG: class IV adenylate cyclase [Candidatus Pacebacteria bacterium]|nr:class IV adenylate cyclase [Candidatus Paceibacterota bacterium]
MCRKKSLSLNKILINKSNGAFQAEKHQVDEYFSPAHRNFLDIRPVEEWLRLRDADGKYSINYKNWHFEQDGKSHYCDKIETKVENINQMKNIFSALDFESMVIVDKLRKIYNYKDYEVAIDSVKNLGDFIEVEYIGTDEKISPAKVAGEMVDFLKEAGCENIMKNYVGYPFLLLFPEEAKYEEQ